MLLLSRLKSFAQRRRQWLYGAVGLFLAYSAFGFFIAPGLVKSRLEATLRAATHRPVSIARLRVNPLVLSVTVDGLVIRAKDGDAWIRCDRIYVNARLLSLLWHTISLKELSIIHPSVQIALDGQGRPEFADLLDSPAPPEGEAKPSRPWTFVISHFSISEGRLPFVDHSTQPDFRTALGPLSLSMDGFRTTPGASGEYSFEAGTDSGERLAWSGTIGVSPFASRGHLSLRNVDLVKYGPYLHETFDMQLLGGKADLDATYRFAWGPSSKIAAVEKANLELREVQVARPGDGQPVVALPTLQASGIHADLLSNQVEVGLIAAKDGALHFSRSQDGSLNIARMLLPPAGVKPKPKNPDAKPFAFTLDEVALQNFRMEWADDFLARPVHLSLTSLDLKLRDFTLDPKRAAQLEVQTRVGETGELRLHGPARLMGFQADLEADGQSLDLASFDPYLDPALNLLINKGRLDFKGQMKLAFEGTRRDGIAYVGDGRVDDFEAADGRDKEVLLRWQRLQLSGLDLGTAPLSLKLRTLAWTAPEGRLVLASDGSSNVARALKLAETIPPSPPAAMVTPTPAPAPGEPPMKLAIGLVTIKDGRLVFIDRSLQPNAALLLDQLNGRYEKLSTDPSAISSVDFRGLTGGLAPLSIKGQAMPFRTDQATDVTVKTDGSSLSDLDPYVRKYIGRTVQKGKLVLDAHVAIQHRKLNVLAKVKLDQFYLGDKVDSPDATHLPVKLALALLRDRQGVIDLELPIEGSLDEPDIKYGKLVWKAIFNVLGKVAASPFTLLGKAFGGGTDLSYLAFAPGSDELTPEAHAKVLALAKSLLERPDLQLEVEGAADPMADAAALRRQALDLALKETPLKTLYLRAFPPDPKSKSPEPPLAEMEQRLLAAQPLNAEALADLAQRRAKATLGVLQQAQAPQDRVFLTRNTRAADEARQSRVWFSVK